MGSEEDAERRGGGRGMVDRVRMNQGPIVNSESKKKKKKKKILRSKFRAFLSTASDRRDEIGRIRVERSW